MAATGRPARKCVSLVTRRPNGRTALGFPEECKRQLNTYVCKVFYQIALRSLQMSPLCIRDNVCKWMDGRGRGLTGTNRLFCGVTQSAGHQECHSQYLWVSSVGSDRRCGVCKMGPLFASERSRHLLLLLLLLLPLLVPSSAPRHINFALSLLSIDVFDLCTAAAAA